MAAVLSKPNISKAIDIAGFLCSGGWALTQAALRPWETVAGVVVGFVGAFVFRACFHFDGFSRTREFGYYVTTSTAFGILLPAAAVFNLISKSPFISGLNVGVVITNLFFEGFYLG